VEILEARIRLPNCVEIDVEVSLRLIDMLRLFCNTIPKRSERFFAVSPTTWQLKQNHEMYVYIKQAGQLLEGSPVGCLSAKKTFIPDFKL